jgi:hypothetical protein
MYVCMYVCMYIWSVDDVANLMPLFCFMLIQGDQLLDAASGGDMATVRRLLEEDPNLVRYKGFWVRRKEKHSTYACMYVSMYALYDRTRPAASSIHMYLPIHLLLFPHLHNMHPQIHILYLSGPPAKLLRHVITEPCILR